MALSLEALGLETFDLFILTSEWVDEGETHELRMYGRSQALGPVELIFDDTPPVFFIDRDELLPALEFPVERKEVGLKSLDGKAVDALYFKTQADLQTAADRFQATGVRHFEADVRPDDRYLMERFTFAQSKIAGEHEQMDQRTTFRNPKLGAGLSDPDWVIASIDIETGVASGELYSIGAHVTGPSEEKIVFMLSDERRDVPEEHLHFYPSQKALLEAFLVWFKEADPDIIIGWHVIGFDLMYLERKCREFNLALDLSRSDRPILLTDKPGSGYFATISGRIVVDGPQTLRSNGFRFPNYKLETVAQSVMGVGKLIASDHNKVAEIERQFREDKSALARYNLEDCVLVTQIYEKLELLPLVFARSRYSGMRPDALQLSNAAFDFYYLPKLHRKGYVAPNAVTQERAPAAEWLLDPESGLFDTVYTLDLSNLYPSMIQIFKIEPLAFMHKDRDPVRAPLGHRFSGSEHLLPHLLTRLVARQEQARGKDAITEKAITMQLKAVAKVLNAPNARFYDPSLSAALHQIGQWFAQESKTFLEGKGCKVVRADEDALFVAPPEDSSLTVNALAEGLNTYWVDRLAKEFQVEARPDISAGTTYNRFLQPESRSGDQRFAALSDELVLSGMDGLLGDWTDMARTFLDGLARNLLQGDDLEAWVLQFVDDLRNGVYDAQLGIQKRIAKPLDEYGKNPPPHIRAARLLDKSPGRRMTYVWTKRGPVPESHKPDDLDHEHYVQKQVTPVADALLGAIGKTFKSITEPEQIGLF